MMPLAAGFMVGFSPLWVRNGHYNTVDIPLATLCLWTMLKAVAVWQKPALPKYGDAALLGALTGLTIDAKYNGVLIALPVALVLSRNLRDRFRNTAGLLILALLGGAWTCFPSQFRSGGWLLTLFTLLFGFVMGRSHAAFQRHLLPVIPFLAVLSARGFEGVGATLARTVARGPRLALYIFVGLASAGPPIYGSVRHDWVMA